MAEIIETCPIWGNRYKAKETFDPAAKMHEVEDSDRTFSGYKISPLLLGLRVKRLSDREKAWLTTWIVTNSTLATTSQNYASRASISVTEAFASCLSEGG